ncbi:hypothetical protein Hanom_Chr12g01100241 [Helianthus anomalus]
MAKHTRSCSGDSKPTFTAHNLLGKPEKEVCNFDNADMAALRASGAFPDDSSKLVPILDLEELDSFPATVQVKKEPCSKPSIAPKPSTSSKPAAMPKPSSAAKLRASSSRKRKESDSLVIAEVFSYENLGFMESIHLMISFHNQGLERLTHLYTKACEIVKISEAKLKKARITIVDQGKIVVASSQHYEDKLKKVTLDAEAAVKKSTQNAEIELVVAEVQHKQDMASFRDGLKGSVVVSLLQAMIKIAYEARIADFKCPT